MSNSLDEIKDATSRIMRRAAADYGDAATEYGNALAAYSKGNKDAVDVAKTAVNLALRQAGTLVENGIALTGAYYRWAFSLIGVRAMAQPQRTVTPAKKDGSRKA